MEPPRENNSPSTPSRYLNSYLQQNSTELFHQNFPSHRQSLPSNQQFYAANAADNLSTTNNKNYLKRHHQNYHNNEKSGSGDSGEHRDKKYEKYDNKKLVDEASAVALQSAYDGFNSDSYASTNLTQSQTAGTASATSTPTTAAAKTTAGGATKSLSNGKKTKGRVKIKMEYIDNKLRRYTTFSKRKTGIMKKVSF